MAERFIPVGTTGQPGMPGLTPIGQAPNPMPDLTLPAPQAPSQRFIPVSPNTPTAGGGGASTGIGDVIGMGLGGIKAGLGGLDLLNSFTKTPESPTGAFGNISPYTQGVAGLSGLYNLAQNIRNDQPIAAVGSGLTAANNLSSALGGPTVASVLGGSLPQASSLAATEAGIGLGAGQMGAGLAGSAVPVLGAALGILQNALGGKMDKTDQAYDATLMMTAAALAGPTGGLSLLGPALKGILGPLVSEKPSVYDLKRNIAGTESIKTLEGISQAIHDSVQAYHESGNLADALPGLQTHFGGARNPVRTDLVLPPTVASSLGFTDNVLGWDQITPTTLPAVLAEMAKQPDQGMSWIRGSGDIGYLEGIYAQETANEVQAQTQDYLHYLMATQGLVPMEPWVSRYEPYAQARQAAKAADVARIAEMQRPEVYNPEGYQPVLFPDQAGGF